MKADLKIENKGELLVRSTEGNILKLSNVLQSSGIDKNIISLSKLVRAGAKIILSNKEIKIVDNKTNIFCGKGIFDGKFWQLDLDLINSKDYKNNDIHLILQ